MGRMRRATLGEVCGWVLEAWNHVPATTIQRAFVKAGITFSPKDDTDEDSQQDTQDESQEDEEPELSAELLRLFHSESEPSDFYGFESD